MAAFDVMKSSTNIIVASVLLWLFLMALQFSSFIVERKMPSLTRLFKEALPVTFIAVVVAITLLLLRWLQGFTS